MRQIPDDAAALADVIETVIRAALAPVVARLRALEATAAVDPRIVHALAAVVPYLDQKLAEYETALRAAGFSDQEVADLTAVAAMHTRIVAAEFAAALTTWLSAEATRPDARAQLGSGLL